MSAAMPSHQRSSANTGRRTHSNSPRHSPAQDYEETLLDQLKDKNTELNKANSERDRYQHLLELANRKLSDSHSTKEDLKALVQGLKDDNALLKEKLSNLEEENSELAYQNEVWDENYTLLEKTYKELGDHYNTLVASVPSSSYRSAMKLPERPKTPHRSSSRKEHKEHKEHKERKSRKEERPRKGEKETKEQKERLSRRFEEKRASSSRSRRTSFIEGWGPGAGGSATSAGSGGRTFSTVATTGLGQSPATSPSHNKVSFSSVPRTTHPLSPSLYKTSGSAIYDDYEDGNYHPYPVGR